MPACTLITCQFFHVLPFPWRTVLYFSLKGLYLPNFLYPVLSWQLLNSPELQDKILNTATSGFSSFPFSFLTWNCLTRGKLTPSEKPILLLSNSDMILHYRLDPHLLCSPKLRLIFVKFLDRVILSGHVVNSQFSGLDLLSADKVDDQFCLVIISLVCFQTRSPPSL